MRKTETKKIVFCASVCAIIIVLAAFGIGIFSISPTISITILHIPVIIGAIVLGKKYGAFIGFVFGSLSCILAFFALTTDAPFTNPLVSVLPRIIFGFCGYPVFCFFKKIVKNQYICSMLAAATLTLIHSILVISFFFLVVNNEFYFNASEYPFNDGNIMDLIKIILSLNCLIEISLAVVICPPVLIALNSVIFERKVEN